MFSDFSNDVSGDMNNFKFIDEDNRHKTDYAKTMTKGIMFEEDIDPMTKLFFSKDNIKRIQKMLKNEVFSRTNGEYKLDVDQDENDLLVAMKAVYFDDHNGARFLPTEVVRQVKFLNKKVIDRIVPYMISEMKQYYSYLKEINNPIKPIMRPMNVSNAGRKTLPSITTTFTR